MNKKIRKTIKNKAGVSAVIGVILMVAITVAIAATVYVYVSGMIDSESPTDMVKSQITIDSNYTIIKIEFKNIWGIKTIDRVEIKIMDFNNGSVITVAGFLYNTETHELGYDNNSDLIKLKEI